MVITRVEYRRLVSGENYSNTEIGAVAEVQEGETPEAAHDALRAWVDARLEHETGLAGSVEAQQCRLWELQGNVRSWQRALVEAKKKHDEVSRILQAHGVTVEALPQSVMDDVPF